MNAPNSVAVDGSDNIFIADSGNNLVKEFLAAEGYTSAHLIGSGFSDPNGIALDASGNVFVADTTNNAVKEVTAASGYTTVIPIGSGFAQPYGVAVDTSGNVFVADYGNLAVKEILAAGNYSNVVSLGGGFSFSGPQGGPTGVAVDSAGNVFVADYGDYFVEEILAAGNYTTVRSLSGDFKDPRNVVLDSHGNIFVADIYGTSVKEMLADGGYTTILTLYGGFKNPAGIALDHQGDVIVVDSGNSTVSRIMTQGANFGNVPVGETSPTNLAISFYLPSTITIASPSVLTLGTGSLDFKDAGTGDICTNGTYPPGTYNAGSTCTVNVSFTPESSGSRVGAIELTDSSGNLVATSYLYGTGTGPRITFGPATNITLASGAIAPSSVAADGSGNIFYADASAGTVTELLASEGYANPHAVGSGFNAPSSIAIDGEGNTFVADTGNNAVKEVFATGGYTTIASIGSGFTAPLGVAVSGGGNVFVVDSSNNPIKEIPFLGGYVSTYSLGASYTNPSGIAVDATGNVFVADAGTLKEIARTGDYTNTDPLATGFDPSSKIALDSNNNIFIADSTNNVVKEVLATGGYTSVNTIGSGFNALAGLFVDGSGNVLVADKGAHAIKRLDTVTPPTLSFSSTAYGSTSTDSPKTVTVTNAGNQPLTFPSPLSGSNPTISDQFSIDSASTCPVSSSTSSPATLAAGTSCKELLSFTPTQVGAISGKLTLVDDSLNAAAPNYANQIILLNGTGSMAPPTISFSVADQIYGASPFAVTATSNSTGAFTYSVVSGPAMISGNTVTLTGTGSVTLKASQAATSQYSAGSATTTFQVSAGTPVISFSVANQVYGTPPFTVTATSNSPGAFTYSVVSGPATISGNTVTLAGAGSVTLQASQAATAQYSAGSATTTFLVATATPAISFSVANQVFGAPPFTVAPTSNSPGAFTYSVVSGPAIIAGNTVTLSGTGSVTLSASQAATANFSAATTTATFLVTEGFTVTATPPSATVVPAGSVDFILTVAPGKGSTFPHPVQLTATGLPNDATATFSPTQVPAGAGTTQVKMTIQTTIQVAREQHPRNSPLSPITFGYLLIPGFFFKRSRQAMRKLPHLLLIATLSLTALLLTTGCGSGLQSRNQDFTITITATDTVSGDSAKTTVNLHVQ
ncbi:sugar lactone lactonase YvrE [Granulicella aggregans]|uniref:Sugar lactone lactonase YvrE n=1 Tax=Granulicella aggregans TaxID=474949 RepID=A0A7W7ZH48_9BACT|nr:choice-of-anchor D domain-containing protein [Granulicella aggregans]MBB5059171.1 sugar lactone lactonase YvrE [Granulicella aggregans]